MKLVMAKPTRAVAEMERWLDEILWDEDQIIHLRQPAWNTATWRVSQSLQ